VREFRSWWRLSFAVVFRQESHNSRRVSVKKKHLLLGESGPSRTLCAVCTSRLHTPKNHPHRITHTFRSSPVSTSLSEEQGLYQGHKFQHDKMILFRFVRRERGGRERLTFVHSNYNVVRTCVMCALVRYVRDLAFCL
jgi:hypothetical protein